MVARSTRSFTTEKIVVCVIYLSTLILLMNFLKTVELNSWVVLWAAAYGCGACSEYITVCVVWDFHSKGI